MKTVRGIVMVIRKLFLPFIVLAAPCILHAAGLDLEKDFRQEIALYRIRPDQIRSLRRDPDGTPLSENRLKEAVEAFYDRLYLLGPGFLKRFKFKEVVFKDTVFDREGDTYQYHRVGDDLFLDADLDEEQFFTNIFFLQVTLMPRMYLERWNKLNPDGFSYERMRGNVSGNALKKLKAIQSEWDKYFVSRTAMYSTEVDMAQTFAYMILKGPNATAFVKQHSPDMEKKFALIAEILESVKAMDRGYMETLIADDLSKLKAYVPYALSVRLEREFSGEWSSPQIAGRMEKADPENPFRIDDPVEVAGRKINPLILSLETKNSRLFRLLMQGKADPNAVNDRKVSALVLAITNNDPEQVKALLKAGAKVTQEAARAGTASGVNAEIVKLMNTYLPGVRQSAGPEKKQDKSSGTGKNSSAKEKK